MALENSKTIIQAKKTVQNLCGVDIWECNLQSASSGKPNGKKVLLAYSKPYAFPNGIKCVKPKVSSTIIRNLKDRQDEYNF